MTGLGHNKTCHVFCVYIKNRPAHLRWAIWFDLFYLSTSNASPDDFIIVIIIIIIVIGKLDASVVHRVADYSINCLTIKCADNVRAFSARSQLRRCI